MDITDDLHYLKNEEEEAYREHLKRIDNFAVLMDSKFQIPLTNIRMGVDSLVGLIPVLGDTLMIFPQCFLIREALKLEISKPTLIKMCGNIFIDWLFGSIPLIGEIFDIGFKCNLRNARLIRKHIEKKLQKM